MKRMILLVVAFVVVGLFNSSEAVEKRLSEEEIEEAIAWGKANKTRIYEVSNRYMFGTPKEGGIIATKYFRLAYASAKSAWHKKELEAKAKDWLSKKPTLHLFLWSYRDSIGFGDDYDFVITQGKKKIKPLKKSVQLVGKQKVVGRTIGQLLQGVNIRLELSYSDLNLEGKLKILLIKGGEESVFLVDLAQYK